MKFSTVLFAAGASAATSTSAAAASTSDACLAIVSDAPKLPSQLSSIFTAASDANYCNLHIPKSASKDWSSYTSAQKSWFKAHESQITKCSYYSQYKSVAATDCKEATNSKETGSAAAKETGSKTAASASGSSKTTGSAASAASGSATGSAASASKSAGAARETGMAVMAVAAAAVAMAL